MKEIEGRPEPGFYWNYKHQTGDPPWYQARYVEELGFNTSAACADETKIFVVLRPLTESSYLFKEGRCYELKLLQEFNAPVTRNGVQVPRYTRILDREVIQDLSRRYELMYGHTPQY